jgi:hypothetical protein
MASAEPSVSPTVLQDEQADPAAANRQGIGLHSKTPSIEIRGPPDCSCDSLNPLSETTYADQDQASASVEIDGVSTRGGLVAPDLPGLRLVNPDISNWHGQVIYLDFDGAKGITYNGPVTVGPFDVPAFQAPGELAGKEQTIISDVLARLGRTFAGAGVTFTTERPEAAQPYSIIYIGGDDSVFAQYGSFLGLAEDVDAGNQVAADNAFVFSGDFTRRGPRIESISAALSGVIAHETGHLLGYAHESAAEEVGASAVSSKLVS